MYGVVAHFDKQTEQRIKDIWRELSDLSISTYAEEVPNRRPHITLASYNHLKIDEYVILFKSFYASKYRLSLSLNSLGTFMSSGLLFFAPTPSIQLLNFHKEHHDYFQSFEDNPDSLYLPEKWVPHCTIANRLSIDKLKEAIEYCTNRMKSIEGIITEITIIKAIYEHGKCISAPTIYTCYLK